MTPHQALRRVETEILGTELPVNEFLGRAQRNTLRAILADVDSEPAPASSTIDRDALLDELLEMFDPYGIDGHPTEHARRVVNGFADRILALLTPDPLLATLTRENEMLTKQVRDMAGRAGMAMELHQPNRIEACTCCLHKWPCATIKVLDGTDEQEPDSTSKSPE